MNCLVTAGPTYEPLDEVRRLTNFSTGRLGSELAQYLGRQGHQVTLLLGYYARVRPDELPVESFTTVADLQAKLSQRQDSDFQAVFHAAAVGDFLFGKIWERTATGELCESSRRKLSSRPDALLAELLPAPKLIGSLAGWFPRACLVGWKYELDGDPASARRAAQRQIQENQTHGCVLNGDAYGPGFGLITGPETCEHFPERNELFRRLEQFAAAHIPRP